MKLVLSILFLVVISHAKDYTYFLPADSKELKSHIERLIKESKSDIDIAMYNFSYNRFAKLLNKAAKRDVDVNVIFDKKKIGYDKSSEYSYLKKKGINCFIADKKMHLKIALFDEKIAILGSLNWTKASFEDNYEIVHITDNIDIINKSKKIFKELKK